MAISCVPPSLMCELVGAVKMKPRPWTGFCIHCQGLSGLKTMSCLHIKNNDVWLSVHVQPGAKHTQWAGMYGDAAKIRLSAPPVDGKANEALCQFLARAFTCASREVSVVRGQTSRQKIICFHGQANEFSAMQLALQTYLAEK